MTCIEQHRLLFVDELEELYTLVPDIRIRNAFVAALRSVADDPSSPVRVVVSLRSDFLDRPSEDRGFMDAITEGMHYLMPLGTDGLREALMRPLEDAGHAFETPALVEMMIAEIATTPGALPLLQFAAAQMWESRDRARRVLTAESYNAMGGIGGTLATHADRMMAEIPWQQHRLVQAVFRRLVTAEGTRAIVDLAELVALAPNDVPTLINNLVTARLLVSNADQDSGATVEIVHESLITAWPQLRHWSEAGRDEAMFLAQLRQAAQQWDARGRHAGLVWRGEMADEARRFAQHHGDTLAEREQSFIAMVLAIASRASRIKRYAVIATMIGLFGLVVVGSVVVVKVRAAEQRAVSGAEVAESARSKLADQLRVINEKDAARVAAEAEAAAASQQAAAAKEKATAADADADASRAQLQKEYAKTRQALAAAQDAIIREQAARQQLEHRAEADKARIKVLESQRHKIATDLH